MAKAPKSRYPESTQDSEKTPEIGKSSVLSQLEMLQKELQEASLSNANEESRNQENYADELIGQFAELIKKIVNNKQIPRMTRLETVHRIQDILAFEAEKLEPRIPDSAPALWNDRRDPDENPFSFAHRVYGDAAKIMVVSDYIKLDPPLGNILSNHKKRGKPIPKNCYIATKKERDNALIENPPTWSELLAKLPTNLRREFLAYKAFQGRRFRSKTEKS